MVDDPPTAVRPLYRKVEQENTTTTHRYMIICNEGWRESIVCCDMYEYVADWLLTALGRRPFAALVEGES